MSRPTPFTRLPILPPGWQRPAGPSRRPAAQATSDAHRAHLREAVQVTTRDQGLEGGGIEIQLGHLCNNRCVFCVSGQLTEQRLARRIPLGPVDAALSAAAERGVRRVTFLGGEPTIQTSFLPALEAARRLGFEEIIIFTNGVRTAQPKFLDSVCALGPHTWRFSIQGGDEASHDRVTQTPGSFAKILSGLVALQGRPEQRVTANACITAFSHEDSVAYVDLVERYGITDLHLDMIRPESAGLRSPGYHRTIQGRLGVLASGMGRMLEAFALRLPRYEVHVGNLPFCLLPDWTRALHHGGRDTATVTTDDRGELSRVHDKYDHQRDGMVHPPSCSSCAFVHRCRGVPKRYLDDVGSGEFVPISPRDRSRRRLRLARLLERLGRVGSAEALAVGDGGFVEQDGVRLIARLSGGRIRVEVHAAETGSDVEARGRALVAAFQGAR